MSKYNQNDPRMHFVPRFLPAVLGLIMLGVYALTLNRWVNLLNVGEVAKISGWVWQPQLYGPVLFLVTLPFRWLPAAHIPLALNLLAALCGALTLTLLARTVILLPHDRTEAERMRERSDFNFLTGGWAIIPPTLAVLFAGLQLTFWQNSTNYTGEIFDLLLFSVVIWQLMEYRLDEQEWRLNLLALVYGAGMTENWAFVTFLPIFITALIWQRRLEFFNLRFLGRMLVGGLVGLSMCLLLPIVAKFSSNYPATFWETLKPVFQVDWMVIKAIGLGSVRHNLALMSLTTLLPIFVLSLRWNPTFGDNSRLGAGLANNLVHCVFAVIFGACVWIMFDSPFSPRQLGMGTTSLSLYYLAALSIGFYSGYFLTVFGKKPIPTRQIRRPLPILPQKVMWLCPVIIGSMLVTAIIMLGTLIYKNGPIVREANNQVLQKYAAAATQSLPRGGGILLCDSEGIAQNQPTRGYLVQAMLAREGRQSEFLVADTRLLNWESYHQFLHEKFPARWPAMNHGKSTNFVNPSMLLTLLNNLSKSNSLYYLNPSFGFYFEQFYQEPHGLIYRLKSLPESTLLPPVAEPSLVAENEKFWSQIADESLATIQKAAKMQALANSQKQTDPNNYAERLLNRLHAPWEPNISALYAGMVYSRSLDFWGVELQRSGDLQRSGSAFALAQLLNPDNVVAAINEDFNKILRAGSATAVDAGNISSDRFGRYHNWNEVVSSCGPFDEISFCFQHGVFSMENNFFGQPMPLTRQALAAFTRVRQLDANNLPARLWLAQIYLLNRQPVPALESLQDPLKYPARFSLTETNATELNVLAAAAHFQKNEIPQGVQLLEKEISRNPGNDALLTTASQAFFARGLYTNVLHVIDLKLARAPKDPQWLFGKGYASLQIGAYDRAISALTQVLEIANNDATARFNRALAYLQSGRLDLARGDYAWLEKSYTNSFQVAFGLAEVAWRQRDTNEAIRNYRLFLINAPTNSVEIKSVHERLTQLGAK